LGVPVQMMRVTPRRFTTRQFSQIGLTLERTFTEISPETGFSGQQGMIEALGVRRNPLRRNAERVDA
jgi:hypothetical protein